MVGAGNNKMKIIRWSLYFGVGVGATFSFILMR